MRDADVASGKPLDALMERAGAALANAVIRFGGGQPVLVLCGPGNNGGDGYVAARVLRERGVDVRVAAHDAPRTELARAAAVRWGDLVEPLGDADAAPVLLDCLFGTGLNRSLDVAYASPLRRLSVDAKFVVAADLPSGVGADDGRDLGATGADLTLAFAAAKPAHLLQPAARHCGRVLIADLGIHAASEAAVLECPTLTAPGPDDHKYTRGMVAVVSSDMMGAGTLAVSAAAQIAGYTVLCGKGDAPHAVVRRGFDKTLSDVRLDAMLIGPGMSNTLENGAKVSAALAERVALVLDAGALTLVTPQQLQHRSFTATTEPQRHPPATVLTPHEGEFVRLFGALPGSKIERARAAARMSNATVVYKGADTVIASPDGRVVLAPPASAWLATAGTGDVLAGILAALLARGLDALDAASAAVWLQGKAARRAGPGLIADDLCVHLAAALAAATR